MSEAPASTTTFAATAARVAGGARFCALFAAPRDRDGIEVATVVSDDGALAFEEVVLAGRETTYASLTPELPAAGWYERAAHDLYGVVPLGHPRLDPLLFPLPPGSPAPLGRGGRPSATLQPDTTPLPSHLHGEGVFTVPYGPVRSGVFEAVEFLVETPGEDIPHLRTRIFYKHRGVESHFAGLSPDDGVLLAERVEGIASVAHASAFCAAVEAAGGVVVPVQAQLVRVVHAELERVANHLDSIVRHTEAAGQAVAYAAFSTHKERVQRLRARLCGSRFGRSVVVPGGIGVPPQLGPDEVRRSLGAIERAIADDVRRLMGTPSFVDRLRGTGVLSAAEARRFALVGPVGRASGQDEDVRTSRPYGAYQRLGHPAGRRYEAGDALARQRVRAEEIEGSFRYLRQAVDLLDDRGEPDRWRAALPPATGRGVGWAEAPQGELLSAVDVVDGRLAHVFQRSASFHNLAAYAAAFPKDIFTDVAFVEASFGVSIAGAAG